MHPSPAPAVSEKPAPLDSTQALAAQLDDVMAQAEIAANSQRDEEAGIPQPESPKRQEAQPEPAAEPAAEQEDEDEPEEVAAVAEPADEPAPEASTETAEPVKYSRRDAARFAQELEAAKAEAAQIKQIAATAQAELNAARAADQHILTQLAEISGYTREANGRYRYENLRDKVLKGTANDTERQEVTEMTQWAELAGPIYRQAEQQVTRAFSVDWQALKDLEGVGDQGMQKLASSPNGVAGAREMHALAFAAGAATEKAKADAQIASLKAQLKGNRIKQVASAPQPAVANGAAVPANGGWFERAFNTDGSINETFDREVRAGKWLGVDLSNQG